MPYTTVLTNDVPSASFLNANYRDQVISTVTSGTRPTGTEGQVIYETDTDRFYWHNGGGWLLLPWTAAGRVGAAIRRAANQSLTNATADAISWDTEDVDLFGFITAPSTTITIPTGFGGVYNVSVSVIAAASLGTGGYVQLTAATAVFRSPVDQQFFSGASVSATLTMAAGTTAVVNVRNSSGGAVNATARIDIWRVGL